MIISLSRKKGKVVFNDFSLKDNVPLNEQLDNLKEDMLQVEFPDGYILDVGWKPSFNINGKFYIYMIKDFDWDNPFYFSDAKDLSSLYKKIELAIDKI
ncbi:hypothetical protein AXX16_4581 [Serratia rubidaea]|uniref:hypothetical protein n=1 Tax=Serratia rubidaea TaxID=61652 RepID=UPI000773B74F|nr:hypothetical protein [Serratia rubidaea]AML60247.1 hypothetical protein AXX16_4581 [Serratia rubidaea]